MQEADAWKTEGLSYRGQKGKQKGKQQLIFFVRFDGDVGKEYGEDRRMYGRGRQGREAKTGI